MYSIYSAQENKLPDNATTVFGLYNAGDGANFGIDTTLLCQTLRDRSLQALSGL